MKTKEMYFHLQYGIPGEGVDESIDPISLTDLTKSNPEIKFSSGIYRKLHNLDLDYCEWTIVPNPYLLTSKATQCGHSESLIRFSEALKEKLEKRKKNNKQYQIINDVMVDVENTSLVIHKQEDAKMAIIISHYLTELRKMVSEIEDNLPEGDKIKRKKLSFNDKEFYYSSTKKIREYLDQIETEMEIL